ncbi:MAG: hypothetical protein D6806_04405, partial [Deltaproteobacteria bacterium]
MRGKSVAIRLREATYIHACLALLLVAACSSGSASTDAGETDAEDGADVDPCAAALPQWRQVWQTSTENTGLEGRTPEINVMD